MLISTSQAAPTSQAYIYAVGHVEKKSGSQLISDENKSGSGLREIWNYVVAQGKNMAYPHPSRTMAPECNRKSGVKTVEKTALIKIENLVTPKIENLVP